MSTKPFRRTTFHTSREMDFFSEKELTAQTGAPKEEWPYIILKELIDNSLDACEEADIPPKITVTADAVGITVSDNGPGIANDTIQGSLDFTKKVSNREMYVAPDRGAQGNALKTLLAMPYVIDPIDGQIWITSHGVRHEIVCRADPIDQEPRVTCTPVTVIEQQGTEIRIQWAKQLDDHGNILWPFSAACHPLLADGNSPCKEKFLELARGYSIFNPHLTLTVTWFGQTVLDAEATNPSWKKWKPNLPTSAHWYEPRHLERLIAAYIAHDRDHGADRTVAEFLAEFNGLTGSRKRQTVLRETRLIRTHLSDLATENGLRTEVIASLLAAMKKHTRTIRPARLGVIGKSHIETRLADLGSEQGEFKYEIKTDFENDIPYVVETAFLWLGSDAPDRRLIYAGANWSPGIYNPFRTFGTAGAGLGECLTGFRAGENEPVAFVLHLAAARVEYTDRGKSAIVLH